MPSYAKIMTDALSEGCYDTSFNQEREDRIRAMNDAQLAGTSQFIAPIVQQSHFKLWRNANAAVLSDIDTVLSYRKEQEILRTKEEESVENKFRDLISRQRDKEAVKKKFDDCLLDDEEFARGPIYWESFNDPFEFTQQLREMQEQMKLEEAELVEAAS